MCKVNFLFPHIVFFFFLVIITFFFLVISPKDDFFYRQGELVFLMIIGFIVINALARPQDVGVLKIPVH